MAVSRLRRRENRRRNDSRIEKRDLLLEEVEAAEAAAGTGGAGVFVVCCRCERTPGAGGADSPRGLRLGDGCGCGGASEETLVDTEADDAELVDGANCAALCFDAFDLGSFAFSFELELVFNFRFDLSCARPVELVSAAAAAGTRAERGPAGRGDSMETVLLDWSGVAGRLTGLITVTGSTRSDVERSVSQIDGESGSGLERGATMRGTEADGLAGDKERRVSPSDESAIQRV